MTDTLTTREAVKAAFDIATTARADGLIDDQVAAASATIERELHRTFRPRIRTIRFDWPHPDTRSSTWRLFLDANELISVTSLVVAGTTIDASDYHLEPDPYGPPYYSIALDQGSAQPSFTSGDTWQQSIVLTGLFGYQNNETRVGALDEALDATETTVDVTAATSASIGVGDYIRADTERMKVVDRGWLAADDTLTAALAAQKNDQTIPVSDGTTYRAGESILIGSETMRIAAVAGNDLTVTRGWDGSTLAAHEIGAQVYAARTLTVERGALGTTAATHLTAADLYRHDVPHDVRRLATLEALVGLGLFRSGGSTEAGSGASAIDTSGAGIARTWENVRNGYQRRARFRSVG